MTQHRSSYLGRTHQRIARCIAGVFIFCLTGCAATTATTVVHPRALAVSQPVAVNEVQSAVVWVHPTEPAKSLLLITNEKKGLEVHDLGGGLLKHLEPTCQPIYVDLIYDSPAAEHPVDLVFASCAGVDFKGVKVWRVDPVKRKLVDVTEGSAIKVLDGASPVGLCTYRSTKTGKKYFFITQRSGAVEQYEVAWTKDETVTATRVRQFALDDEVKSCIADEERGVLYVAEDHTGIWRYPAEPDSNDPPKLVIKVGENGLIPSVKGPALYGASGGTGYLLVLGQSSKIGHPCIKVYDRQGDNAFILTIEPSSEGFGPLDHSAGLAICNQPTNALFPHGVVAINDQINPNASEDFKLFSWSDIAKPGGLIIDEKWSRRGIK